MKAKVNGLEVEGTPDEIAVLVKALNEPAEVTETRHSVVAQLTPKQREVWDRLAEYNAGCHYQTLAEDLGIEPSLVNSRLNGLKNNTGTVERIGSGIFKAVRL